MAIAFDCLGAEPNWTLRIGEDTARFEMQRQINYDIPLISIAENRDWPKVYTLVVDFDTAIATVDRDTCRLGTQDYPLSVDILTQRGETPIVLTGCCIETNP